MSSASSGSYSKRKPIPIDPDSPPPKNGNKTTDLGHANHVPTSTLKGSGAGTPTGAISGSAQTTILQPVMSTMKITSALSPTPITHSHPSTDAISSLNSSNEHELSSEKQDYGEFDVGYKTTSSSAGGFTLVDNKSSPPISPGAKLPSLNDLLASSEAMLTSFTAPKSLSETSFLDTADDMLMQLLVSQAIIDSRDFKVLSLEEVEELKKDHSLLTTRISALTSKLSLETKIRDAASSLARLHSSNKRLSRQATDHLSQANRKVDQVATDLWKLTQRAGEVQRKLLQHMAGVLSAGFRKLEEKQVQSSTQNLDNNSWEVGNGNGIDNIYNEIMGIDSRSSDKALLNKVSNLENSVQNAHQKLAEARLALKRKDKEIEELKQKVDDTVTEARERTVAELRTELEEIASRLDIALRKHKAGNLKNGANSENEDSDESDSGGSFYRLSTMTTATQHLQKEQYKNITENMSALEKVMEEYMFRIYKLEQELNSVRNNPDGGEFKSLQNELQGMLEESESDKKKIKEMESELSELRTQVKQVRDLESQIKEVELRTSDRGMGQNRVSGDMELKLKKLTREHDELVDSLKLTYMNLPDERNSEGNYNVGSRKPKFSVGLFISRVKNLGEENSEYMEQISLLKSQLNGALGEVNDSKQDDLKAELESTRNELEETKSRLLDMESKATNAQSNVEVSSTKQSELLKELEEVREQLKASKENVRKYEAILKRQSVMQIVDNGISIKEEFQQQLAAQEQEYEAQIKERDFTITKLRNDLRNVDAEKEKVSQVVADLENMLKSKSRTLDQREVTINKLEEEIGKHKLELAELKAKTDMVSTRFNKLDDISSYGGDGMREEIQRLRSENERLELNVKRLEASLADAQKQFSMREESMEKRSEIMQTELDGTLKEFDRLTKNFIDFDNERQKLQAFIDELQSKCEKLENELADEKIKYLGMDAANAEPTTTVTLRKEFRKMMADLRGENQKLLRREMDEKKKLETTVRNLKREKEAEKWEKVNKGTQTRFVISVGSG